MVYSIGSSRRLDLLFAVVPLFLWIGVIFLLSSNVGSMSHTSMIIRPVLNLLFPGASEETLQLYHAYVRKAAHFTEYAVLAFLAFRSFYRLASGSGRRSVYAFVVVVVVAVLDEFNQSFEISRTSSTTDVILDILGGVAMLATIWCWYRLRKPNDY